MKYFLFSSSISPCCFIHCLVNPDNFRLFFIQQLEIVKKRFTNDNQTMKQQEFTRILQEEIKLLNEIERKRNETMQIAVEEQNDKHLIQLGEPIKWIGYKSNNSYFVCSFESIGIHSLCRPGYLLNSQTNYAEE